tara:strand:+ start:220 stop:807 length:588 start_codon:yes stop_codon:yes gene_type:complete
MLQVTGNLLDEAFPLQRTRRRILKVNHAGERGAIAIYQAQLLFSRFWPDTTNTFLREALSHERSHAAAFRGAMMARNVRPCPGTAIWIVGGFGLGLVSVLGGLRGVMACTAAIETAVHGHLDEQIAYLRGRDDDLVDIIAAIQIEEAAHMEEGAAGYDPDCTTAGAFTGFVSAVTEALIWLATFGDSARMRAALT